MVSPHPGEKIYQEKIDNDFLLIRCGAAGGQNIGPGYTKVEAAKRELGTRVDVKLHHDVRGENCVFAGSEGGR